MNKFIKLRGYTIVNNTGPSKIYQIIFRKAIAYLYNKGIFSKRN